MLVHMSPSRHMKYTDDHPQQLSSKRQHSMKLFITLQKWIKHFTKIIRLIRMFENSK